jgi:signal transduction histidine kinase
VRLRLDALAEELERRVDWTAGLAQIDGILLEDLRLRFPDPVYLLDPDGALLLSAMPADSPDEAPSPLVPPRTGEFLVEGDISIAPDLSWALAPVYDDAGFLVGGILISPLDQTVGRELEPARQALLRATAVATFLVFVMALLLAAGATWALVRPLRRMADRVESIGRGEYDSRVAPGGPGEFERLGSAINAMAAAVAESIERLRSTDAMRRELVANVGHDLRTPLASVIGRLEEADRLLGAGRGEDAAAHISQARKQSAYLVRLVDDLFELSVLETPDPPLRLEPVPISELLHDVAAADQGAFESRGIHLVLETEPALPVLEADGMRLLRLLENLLSNARRHAPAGGHVWLRASVSEGKVQVCVEDDGGGIPADRLERLFDRYYRGEDARTRTERGTGLGLAIARAVATAHHGTLTAENRAEGGARFVLRLPLSGLPSDPPGDPTA